MPSELVVLLSQDNDGDVRAALVEQLPELGAACARLASTGAHEADADELAVTLLDTALALVEDDVEAVVTAAEAAVPALAPLFRPDSEPETAASAVCDPLVRLAASEEEEVRVSACRIAGSLAQPLGRELCDAHLVDVVIRAAEDVSFRVRKTAAVAMATIAQQCGRTAASERILPSLLALSADPVWTVRKVVAEVLVEGVTAAAASPSDAADQLHSAFTRLCDDDDGPGPWVRHAALSALGPALVAIHTGGRPQAVAGLLQAHYASAATNDDTAIAIATSFWDTCSVLGTSAWPDVRPAFEALCASRDPKVRTIAAGVLPKLASWLHSPHDVQRDVVPRFRDQCSDVAPEVAVAALDAALPVAQALPPRARPDVLCPALCAAAATGVHVMGERHACGAWRVRAAAMAAMERVGNDSLSAFAAGEDGNIVDASAPAAAADVAETLLPTALAGTRDPAAAVRSAAADACATLLAIVNRGASGGPESSIILADACTALRTSGASGDYLQRLTFVRSCSVLAGFADAPRHPLAQSACRLLQRELAPLLLSLADDPVASVRCAVARVVCGSVASEMSPSTTTNGAAQTRNPVPAAPIGWATEGELCDARLLLESDEDQETRKTASGFFKASPSQPARPRQSVIAAKHPPRLGLLQRRALEAAAQKASPAQGIDTGLVAAHAPAA